MRGFKQKIMKKKFLEDKIFAIVEYVMKLLRQTLHLDKYSELLLLFLNFIFLLCCTVFIQ